MIVNARLVALGVLLLFLSSGLLLLGTGVSDALALSIAGVEIAGTGLAAIVAVRTAAAETRPT